MRAISPVFLLVLGLLALPWALLPHPEAGADEKAPKGGLWLYEVRVVHVQADAVTGLEPAPWEGAASTVATSWKEHLAALQARGKVFVMLDQRVSAQSGDKTKLECGTTIPIRRFDNEAGQHQVRRFDRLDTGVSVSLKTDTALEYGVDVKWVHYAPQDDAVPSAKTDWDGTHPPIANGRTLALVHREHIRGRTGEIETAEIHCFITARFTAE